MDTNTNTFRRRLELYLEECKAYAHPNAYRQKVRYVSILTDFFPVDLPIGDITRYHWLVFQEKIEEILSHQEFKTFVKFLRHLEGPVKMPISANLVWYNGITPELLNYHKNNPTKAEVASA